MMADNMNNTGWEKDEATEVLKDPEPVRSAPTPPPAGGPIMGGPAAGNPIMGNQAVKVLCKSCRNAINRDAAFCPICGASQREEPADQGNEKKASSKKIGIIAAISGAGVVVLAAAVVIGVLIGRSSSNDDTDDTPDRDEWIVSEEPTPTPEILSDSKVIMTLGLGQDDDAPKEEDKFLTTDIARNEIASVTFLDSLAQMPENAWDVSEDGNKLVMAWADQREDGYYDVYIGAEGGVEAHRNSTAIFTNMNHVEQIQLGGNFHTEGAEEMSCLFAGCISLEELDVSSLDTSNVTDMSNMFYDCGFTGLDVSSFDTSKVTDMHGMFADCYLLSELDLSGFDTSNVTNMRGMFQGCRSLTSMDLSGFNTSNVTDMGLMFDECRSLVSVNVSGFDTSNVTDMGLMFYECRNLTDVDVSGFNTANVINTNNMFFGCVKLNGLDLSNFDSSLVASMQYTGTAAGVITLQGYDFSEAYRQEFAEYENWAWHETFVYLDDPDHITHILYMDPENENSAEAAFMWDGPRMDAGYRVEAGIVVTLYGDVNGQTAYRMKFLTMDGKGVQLKNGSDESLLGLFDAELQESVVAQDDEYYYSTLYLVSNSWTKDYTALIYAVQDFEQGVIYIIEYSVQPAFFNIDYDLDVITDISIVNLEDFGIDKRAGLVGGTN